MDILRVPPRAVLTDRLALKFALVCLAAFAGVGAALHLLIVRDAPRAQMLRVDFALAGGLVFLFAVVLPLALRTGRTMQSQTAQMERQTGKLSALVDQMPALVWTTDTDLVMTETAGSGLSAIGLEPNEHRGLRLQEVLETDDPRDPAISAHRKALEGEPADYQIEFGGRILQACVQPLRRGRRIVGVVGAAFDITERKQAETSLERLRRQHALILDSAAEGIIGVGIRGNATFVNPGAARMLGWEVHELLGRNVHAVFHHSLADGQPYPIERCPIHAVLDDGTVREVADEVFWRRDGERFDVEYVAAPLRQNDSVIGAVLVFRDVTERKRAEQDLERNFQLLRKSHDERRRLVTQLVHAEEEERRRIAGDIHDDSLQLMAAVAMHLYNVRRFSQSDEEASSLEALEETVREAIGRLRHLLFDLRPPTLDREGLAAALRLYLEQTVVPAGASFEVVSKLRAEPPTAVRTILYRIAQEALANVHKHAGASRVDVTLEMREGGFLIRIRDDGRGFNVEEQATPRPGHLGISAMRERAEVTGGWFRVDSDDGNGTTVEFFVPVEEPAEAVAGP